MTDPTRFLTDTAPSWPRCSVTPLLDGAEYADALRRALDRVGDGRPGQTVLIAGWWLGLVTGGFELVPGGLGPRARPTGAPPYCLDPWPDPDEKPFDDPPDTTTALLDVLIAKARAGVDVRVLGWVSPAMLRLAPLAVALGGAHTVAINTLTRRSLRALRDGGVAALPAVIGHLSGSTHQKTVLVCDGDETVAFTGGLDLELSRWSRTSHAGRQTWHDVVAMVRGPAVQAHYDQFRMLWQANLAAAARGGESWDANELPERRLPVAETGAEVVQSLRTLPAGRYRWPVRHDSLPEASFSYRDALRRAIEVARDYVYLEDPLLWSSEVMEWLNRAVRANARLRVVLLTGALEDPNDPPLPHEEYFGRAAGVLADGLDSDQLARVRVLRRTGLVVHAKTVIADDTWASIGSCNLAQRSLYTDIEYGVGFTGPAVSGYRSRLWAHHLGRPAEELADPHAALDAWGPGETLSEVTLPVPAKAMTRRQRWMYRVLHDVDSRRRWP